MGLWYELGRPMEEKYQYALIDGITPGALQHQQVDIFQYNS